MSKLNKIITNNSVQLSESEISNLIMTLGPVIEAFTGGGGGQGSVIYTPGDDNISINNTQHTIALSTDAATKLNTPIPTKVSDLTDSANYATTDAINAKLDKDEFAAVSGDFATEQYVQAASAEVTGWVNNQNYLTQVPDTYYLKTETSGKDELSAAFDNILNYDVTAAAGIKITTATDNGTTTFGISMTAQPVVTDTTLSGYNGIAATRDGEVNNQWNIGLTQDQLNTINGKLDSSDFTTYTGTTAPNTYLTKTSADTLYQPTGNYVTTADVLTGTSNTLTGIKIGSTNYTIPTTDLSNYYTKTQVDSTFASASQLNSYLTTAQYQTDSATFVLKTQLDDYATKEYANNASANALSEAETWVGDQGFLKATDLTDYATKTYANEASAYALSQAETYADTASAEALLQAKTWVEEQGYLPTSGGTVFGETILSGAQGNFDNSYLKFINNNSDYFARFGIGRFGGAVIKAGSNGLNPVQLNVKPSNNNNELVELQNNGSTVGNLIPAKIHTGSYTPSANDGILHIILES